MQGRHSATTPYPPFYCKGLTGLMVASHETDLSAATFPTAPIIDTLSVTVLIRRQPTGHQ